LICQSLRTSSLTSLLTMADPFGITGVAIASLSVGRKLQSLISELKQAPSELLALSNEISNIKLVLDTIQDAINVSGEAGMRQYDRLGPLLFQARIKLDRLAMLVKRWGTITERGDGFVVKKLDRIFWIKEKKEVWELQRRFREIRANLSVLMQANTL
jgi:hypothetical protein